MGRSLQEFLKRKFINGARFGAVLLSYSLGVFIVGALGGSDLLAVVAPLIIPIVAYSLERSGKIFALSGMTMPALLVSSTMALGFAALNAVTPFSAGLAVAAFGLFAASVLFTIWRLFTNLI